MLRSRCLVLFGSITLFTFSASHVVIDKLSFSYVCVPLLLLGGLRAALAPALSSLLLRLSCAAWAPVCFSAAWPAFPFGYRAQLGLRYILGYRAQLGLRYACFVFVDRRAQPGLRCVRRLSCAARAPVRLVPVTIARSLGSGRVPSRPSVMVLYAGLVMGLKLRSRACT